MICSCQNVILHSISLPKSRETHLHSWISSSTVLYYLDTQLHGCQSVQYGVYGEISATAYLLCNCVSWHCDNLAPAPTPCHRCLQWSWDDGNKLLRLLYWNECRLSALCLSQGQCYMQSDLVYLLRTNLEFWKSMVSLWWELNREFRQDREFRQILIITYRGLTFCNPLYRRAK